jgi:hypothetical protein
MKIASMEDPLGVFYCAGRVTLSEILSQALEYRMTNLPLGGFRPVFDFGQQRRLDPDAAMRDALAVRLGIPDQRLEARA